MRLGWTSLRNFDGQALEVGKLVNQVMREHPRNRRKRLMVIVNMYSTLQWRYTDHAFYNFHTKDVFRHTNSKLARVHDCLWNPVSVVWLVTLIFLCLHLWQPALDFLCDLLGGILYFSACWKTNTEVVSYQGWRPKWLFRQMFILKTDGLGSIDSMEGCVNLCLVGVGEILVKSKSKWLIDIEISSSGVPICDLHQLFTIERTSGLSVLVSGLRNIEDWGHPCCIWLVRSSIDDLIGCWRRLS